MNAGIIDNINSPNLLLSLEPEGASIQCREDSEENIHQHNKMVYILYQLVNYLFNFDFNLSSTFNYYSILFMTFNSLSYI